METLHVLCSLVHSKMNQPPGLDGELRGDNWRGGINSPFRSQICRSGSLKMTPVSISTFAGIPRLSGGGTADSRRWAPLCPGGHSISWSQRPGNPYKRAVQLPARPSAEGARLHRPRASFSGLLTSRADGRFQTGDNTESPSQQIYGLGLSNSRNYGLRPLLHSFCLRDQPRKGSCFPPTSLQPRAGDQD